MERLLCLIIGYVFGMFQTGFIYGKINHIDIREHGSGNAGTTNALRTLGWKAGFITFAGDILKAVLASLVVRLIFRNTHTDSMTLLVLYTGIGTVLGHNFPFYLHFKGGKGIAATAGVIVSLGCWQLDLLGFAAFMLTLFITRYVSAGSLVMVLSVFAGFVVFDYIGLIGGLLSKATTIEATIVMLVFVILAFVRHKANIKRLLHGEENEFKLKKNMVEEEK